MAEQLSEEQKRAYIAARGLHCPLCNSRNIEVTGKSGVDEPRMTVEVECHSCGALWDDIYMLTDVDWKSAS